MEKRRFDLLPWKAIRAAAFIMAHGVEKHGADTWRDASIETHLDAAFSHMAYWADGRKIDGDTQKSHLWNALARLMFVVEQEINQDTIANKLTAIRSYQEPQDQL